jgi:V-type H+-transporting ATPase subunit a
VYSFGVDSIWKVAENEMSFTNSLKMKAAVILGVIHMMFGLLIKLINNIRQRQILDIVTLTIPQIIFMSCTFVYMDFLIILKWNSTYESSYTAPSIISTMISVFVNMASENEKDLLFWEGERAKERIIVVIALLCVPIMLLGKTIVIYCRRRRSASNNSHLEVHELAEEND